MILLDERQAAKVLSFSVHTLRSWRSRGVGPPTRRIGRSIRYHVDDLNHWIAAQAPKARKRQRLTADLS